MYTVGFSSVRAQKWTSKQHIFKVVETDILGETYRRLKYGIELNH